jgi:hypothetical protein
VQAATTGAVEPVNDRARIDWAVCALLGAGAMLMYAIAFHPDWSYDPLRYAELTQRGPVRILLGPQHVLGNLLPFAAYRAARGLGYDGRAMPVLAAFAVVGAAVAVAAIYLAAVRLGGTRLAAATSAGVFAVTVAAWRAGGGGGVYGVALAGCALGWVAIAAYVRAPSDRTAAVLGLASGAAVAAHLENVAFVGAALLVVALTARGTVRWRRLGIVVLCGAALSVIVFVVTSGIATGWSASGMWRWVVHPGIGGPADRSSQVGWGVGGLYAAVSTGQRALAVAVLVVAAVRIAMLSARSGIGRVLAAAVVVNAGIAFLLSSWYQALRLDYWGLGLVPLAVGAGAGTPIYGRSRPWRRIAGVAAAVALVIALLAWNGVHEVAPSLRQSDANARTVAAIEAHVPRGARVVASLPVSGRLADIGYLAEPGSAWARALPGVPPVRLYISPGEPIYMTSDAFGLTSAQIATLGMTSDDIWMTLRESGLLHRIARVQRITLYRLP